MKNHISLTMALFCWCIAGCHSYFMDGGAGYTRFQMDPIKSTVTINSRPVETKLTHVDGFISKMRAGGGLVEALPQLRGGMEIRGGLGGALDTKDVSGQTAYSELVMLLFGGGPFISWKQPLGNAYLEAGTFVGGYTFGVHEKGRKRYGLYYDISQSGSTGWSGGLFGKIGIIENLDAPTSFAIEGNYEVGELHFDNDAIGTNKMQVFSVLLSAEISF